MTSISARFKAGVRRSLARRFRRRALRIETRTPLISFTFDDAMVTAFEVGSEILTSFDARATYYVSLGLLDEVTEFGQVGGRDHLRSALVAGHELGCHTFDHLDAWSVSRKSYMKSVEVNQRAIGQLVDGYVFRSFAYPKNGATVSVKSMLSHRFESCRGGGQGLNVGVVDRNLLSACFLDARTEIDSTFVSHLIDINAESNGWLIFVAHDIANQGSVFRTSPDFLEATVRAARSSGADLIPVGEACKQLVSRVSA